MEGEGEEEGLCVGSVLADASKFVIDFAKMLTEVCKFGEVQIFEIHDVLFDAWILDTCCVANEQVKVTCFVMNANNFDNALQR